MIASFDVATLEKIDALLSQMTLKEKISLFAGKNVWQTVDIPRLGIPSITMTDGPHGVRANETIPYRISGPATSFPTGIALASTWNPDLVEKVGAALGQETRAMGCEILLGPCINIVRSPLGGRNFETYAEDPYLAGRIAVSYVQGVQGQGIGTSVKHFACNNQEFERFRGNSIVDERTLREIYLSAFEAVIKEARPWTVMHSYNRLNGIYNCENRRLLTEILRDEWGFEGAVVSDWGATHSTVESVKAGLDIEMPGPAHYFGKLLVEAVENWQVPEKVIDEAARRVLYLIFRSGKTENVPSAHPASVNTPEHQNLACAAAEEAIILLKNDRSLLPLDPGKVDKIAVIGPNAANLTISGGGSSYLNPPYVIQPLAAIQSILGDKVIYEPGCSNLPGANIASKQLEAAISAAKSADTVILFVGMPKSFETEGSDRPHMGLPGPQDELVGAVVAANPKTIVVLNCGAPVAMPWTERVPAIVHALYPGLEGGKAIANVLFGRVNPSGKLTVTYPRNIEDNPAFINYPGLQDVLYGEGIFVGYRYYDKKKVVPLFPFGHGLSYTTFAYGQITVTGDMDEDEKIHVSIEVSNTGGRAGKEIVQLYVRDVISTLIRPLKELKGFKKVEIQSGETQVVEFDLDFRSFAYYDPYIGDWILEPGEFELLVGSSSKDIRSSKLINISK